MDRPLVWLPVLALLVCLAAVSLFWASVPALAKSDDLMRRAAEVGLFLERQDPYQDPDMTYPPPALAVFTPLVGPLARSDALLRGFWLVLNLVALVVVGTTIVWLWGERWPAWLQAAFLLMVAASKPVRAGIGLGQFHLIPLALLLLAVAALQKRRPIAAGLLVGLALAKPTMCLPFLGYLVVRRQWRALAAAAVCQCVALLAVSAWLGIGPWRLVTEWVMNARTQEARGTIDLPSLVARAWPQAPLSATPLALAVLGLSFVVMFGCRRSSDLALVSFCSFMSAVFTYHRHYDLVLLIPALAFAIDTACGARDRWVRPKAIAAVAFALVLIAPSNATVTGSFEKTFDAAFLAMSYGFLALTIFYLITSSKINPTPKSTPNLVPHFLGEAGAECSSAASREHERRSSHRRGRQRD